jgi:hypothetical protein
MARCYCHLLHYPWYNDIVPFIQKKFEKKKKEKILRQWHGWGRVVKQTDKDEWTDELMRMKTMATWSFVTWMHCSVCFIVT